MCRSMVDIQSRTAEIRRGKKRRRRNRMKLDDVGEEKKEERRKNKPQHENIHGLPIP